MLSPRDGGDDAADRVRRMLDDTRSSGGLVDEILIAGDRPHVAAGCQLQRMRELIVEISARGQSDMESIS